MSVRPRLKKTPSLLPRPTATSYQLMPVNSRSNQRRNALVVLSNGVELTQNPALPRLPGQIGLRGDCPIAWEDIDRVGPESRLPVAPSMESMIFGGPDIPSPSKHRAKRLKQWERWTTEILPELIQPYLELQRKTQSLREDATLDLVSHACECCASLRKLSISVIRFSSELSVQHVFITHL